MTCVGHCKIKPYMYGNFMEENICIHTNNMLENGSINIYQALKLNVINASIIFAKYKP